MQSSLWARGGIDLYQSSYEQGCEFSNRSPFCAFVIPAPLRQSASRRQVKTGIQKFTKKVKYEIRRFCEVSTEVIKWRRNKKGCLCFEFAGLVKLFSFL